MAEDSPVKRRGRSKTGHAAAASPVTAPKADKPTKAKGETADGIMAAAKDKPARSKAASTKSDAPGGAVAAAAQPVPKTGGRRKADTVAGKAAARAEKPIEADPMPMEERKSAAKPRQAPAVPDVGIVVSKKPAVARAKVSKADAETADVPGAVSATPAGKASRAKKKPVPVIKAGGDPAPLAKSSPKSASAGKVPAASATGSKARGRKSGNSLDA